MSHKLFIGHLNPDTRTQDLEDFFKDNGFAKFEEIIVKQGYGFIRFDDKRDAEDAIYELNGKDVDGSRIQIEFAKSSGGGKDFQPRDRYDDRDRRDGGGGSRGGGGGRDGGGRDGGGRDGGGGSRYGRPYNTNHRIIVNNVSSSAAWQDVKDLFRRAGEVTFASCHRDRVGEAVIEFASASEMKSAFKKMDGEEFMGKCLKLECPTLNGSRSRSRSRSPRRRSRSRSRSPARRSRSRSRSASPRRSASKSKSRSPPPKD